MRLYATGHELTEVWGSCPINWSVCLNTKGDDVFEGDDVPETLQVGMNAVVVNWQDLF
jgi:hypothetical protein